MGARPLSDTSQGVLGDSLRATWSMGYGVIGGRGPQGPTSSFCQGLEQPPNQLGPGGPTLSSETGPEAPPYHQSQGPRPHLIIRARAQGPTLSSGEGPSSADHFIGYWPSAELSAGLSGHCVRGLKGLKGFSNVLSASEGPL